MEVSISRHKPFLILLSFMFISNVPAIAQSSLFHPYPLTLVTTMKLCLSVFLLVWDTWGSLPANGDNGTDRLVSADGCVRLSNVPQTPWWCHSTTLSLIRSGHQSYSVVIPQRVKSGEGIQGKRNRPSGSSVALGYRIMREGSRVG